jgi:hypothetical protein
MDMRLQTTSTQLILLPPLIEVVSWVARLLFDTLPSLVVPKQKQYTMMARPSQKPRRETAI